MASFKDLLDRILNAVYGEDVRGSIHDGLEMCYDEMTAGKDEVKAGRQEIAAARQEIADARVEIAADRAAIDDAKDAVAEDRAIVVAAEKTVTEARDILVPAIESVTQMHEDVMGAEIEVAKDRQEVASIRDEIEAFLVTENYHTVSFYNEGTLIDMQLVIPGSDAIDPVISGKIIVPQKQGYVFTGWDKEFTNITGPTEINALFGESIALWDLIEGDITGPYVNDSVTTLGDYAFAHCVGITSIDLASAASIGSYTFSGCTALETVILRNTALICKLTSTTAFENTPIKSGTGYIYVPFELVDSYKTAANWSTYADQIMAIGGE